MSVHTSVQVGGAAVLGAAAVAETARLSTSVLAFTGNGVIHLMAGTGAAFVALGTALVRRGRGQHLDAGTPLDVDR